MLLIELILIKTRDLLDKGLWDGVVDTVGGKILS